MYNSAPPGFQFNIEATPRAGDLPSDPYKSIWGELEDLCGTDSDLTTCYARSKLAKLISDPKFKDKRASHYGNQEEIYSVGPLASDYVNHHWAW